MPNLDSVQQRSWSMGQDQNPPKATTVNVRISMTSVVLAHTLCVHPSQLKMQEAYPSHLPRSIRISENPSPIHKSNLVLSRTMPKISFTASIHANPHSKDKNVHGDQTRQSCNSTASTKLRNTYSMLVTSISRTHHLQHRPQRRSSHNTTNQQITRLCSILEKLTATIIIDQLQILHDPSITGGEANSTCINDGVLRGSQGADSMLLRDAHFVDGGRDVA